MDSPDPAPPREDRASVTAPRVQIVVVVEEATERLEEVFTSLVAQDYPRFDLVALVSRDDAELAATVSTSASRAEVRLVDDQAGFGTAANQVLEDGSPPAFYLFCQQDAALASDGLRLLVEEAIRSNASIVGPKLVDWDDPDRLVDVGLDVDKLGHAVSRVEPGELDQEQHDAVVDVFAVPKGVQLVRGDVFHALDGFDPTMDLVVGDVDFCWRSHVAGARVMVVPSAIARVGGVNTATSPAEYERTRERNRVRMLLSVYGVGHSIRVVPQGILYTFFRSLGALLVGQFGLARAAIGGWTWNIARPGALYQRRKKLKETRKIPDREIRPLQVRGFAPLSAYFRGQLGDQRRGSIGSRIRNVLISLRTGPSRVSLGFWAIAALVLIFGSRHLITRGVPEVGDLVPFDLGPRALFSRFFDGWSGLGTGHEASAPTAFGLTGLLGLVLFASMGLLRTILTVGMLPIGAIGIWRLLRPFSSPWIRVVGTMAYLVSPVPYNALANGSWGALVLYGLLPWVVASLGRAARVAPFGRLGGATGEGVLEESPVREILVLGLVAGLIGAFVPFVVVLILAMALAIMVGSVLAGWPGGSGRLAAITVGGCAVGALLNFPWLIAAIFDEPDWDWFGGTRPTSPEGLELAEIFRFDTGPIGGSPLGWALPIAGVVPLLLARGPRWAWAVRGLVLYLASVAAVWAVGNGWVDRSLPRPEILFVAGALGLAISAAMGVAAIERDLRTYKFGWRQLAPVTAVVALFLAVLAPIGAAFDGSWQMPSIGFNDQFSDDEATGPTGRVLWIGHDDVLGGGGRRFGQDLTVSVTGQRQVSFVDRWAGTPQPADPLINEALTLAVEGGTSRLGRLLAPFAIGEIVVLEQLAPAPEAGFREPVPDAIIAALTEQLDLEQVEVAPGLTRYRNVSGVSEAAVAPEGTFSGVTLSEFSTSRQTVDVSALAPEGNGWSSYRGPVTTQEEVYLAAPASSRWSLEVEGRTGQSTPALGWANAYQVPLSGDASLTYDTSLGHRLLMVGQVALWVVAVFAILRLSSRSREAQL